MLQTVDVGERSLEAYRGVAPEPILGQLQEAAARLRGARVLHINATPCAARFRSRPEQYAQAAEAQSP